MHIRNETDGRRRQSRQTVRRKDNHQESVAVSVVRSPGLHRRRTWPWTLTLVEMVSFFCWHLLKMQIFDRTKLVQRERMFKLERTTLCRSKQIGSPSCNYLHLPCRRTTISFWTERGVVKQDLQQRQQQPESGVWHRHRLKDSSISRSWMSCCENRFPPLWFRNDDRERYRNTIDYRQHR